MTDNPQPIPQLIILFRIKWALHDGSEQLCDSWRDLYSNSGPKDKPRIREIIMHQMASWDTRWKAEALIDGPQPDNINSVKACLRMFPGAEVVKVDGESL